jgi:hypothetical protein
MSEKIKVKRGDVEKYSSIFVPIKRDTRTHATTSIPVAASLPKVMYHEESSIV